MLGEQFVDSYSASGEPCEEKSRIGGATYHAGACDHKGPGLWGEDYRCTRVDSSNFRICTSPRCHTEILEYAFGYFSEADYPAKTINWNSRQDGSKSPYLEASLFLSPVIHASSDDVPSAIYVRDVSPPQWARGRQGQLHTG